MKTQTMDVIRDATGNIINIGLEMPEMPEGAYACSAEIVDDDGLFEKDAWLRKKANQELSRTDFVHAKALETQKIIAPDWKGWRQTLRDIANGSGQDIPPEPERYGDGDVAAEEVIETEIVEVEPEPEPALSEVPEGLIDLIRENEPYGAQAEELMVIYNALTNKIMLNLATDVDRALHSRLVGSLDWIRRKAAEVISA
jgi:hypothetical protein